jgi:hypothetical protein
LRYVTVENIEMTRQRAGFPNRIRGAVAVATVFAMSLVLVAPALAAESATFSGAVMAPDNSFAQGFTVVFKEVATGQEFKSAPTSATGEYHVSVPTGGRYKLDSVQAPDGTKLAVQNVPPIPVRVAGVSKLDVKFTNAGPPAGTAVAAAAPAAGAAAAGAAAGSTPAPKPAAPAAAATTASSTPAAKPATPATGAATASTSTAGTEEKKKKDKGAVPWWKKPGPIVGMVLGGAAIVAIAVSGGGDDNPPVSSQSTP